MATKDTGNPKRDWLAIGTLTLAVLGSVAYFAVRFGALEERVAAIGNQVAENAQRNRQGELGPRGQMCVQLGEELGLALRTGDRDKERRAWDSIERLQCPAFEATFNSQVEANIVTAD